MWRKKVDSTLLQRAETPIPRWLWGLWDIEKTFDMVLKKVDYESKVELIFDNQVFSGNVVQKKKPGGYGYRLFIDKRLASLLCEVFLMSYMRAIESDITKSKNNREVEDDISFWEFLDIEFDVGNKRFNFVPHFIVRPQFPNLFAKLIGSAPLKAVGAEVLDKATSKIHKQDWQPRANYVSEIGAENVIYMLIDKSNKLLYVGETEKLIRRFDSGHPDITTWDYYKFNVLPKELAPYRLELERMLIRDMATILRNKKNISNIVISEYFLVNRKIDE